MITAFNLKWHVSDDLVQHFNCSFIQP